MEKNIKITVFLELVSKLDVSYFRKRFKPLWKFFIAFLFVHCKYFILVKSLHKTLLHSPLKVLWQMHGISLSNCGKYDNTYQKCSRRSPEISWSSIEIPVIQKFAQFMAFLDIFFGFVRHSSQFFFKKLTNNYIL